MTDNVPAPRTNLSATGFRDRATDVATSAAVRVAVGDYTGGAADDMFTLASHGLKTGDVLHVLWESAMGGVTGGEGTKGLAKVLSSSTFQITTLAGVVIENTADATVAFLKGDVSTALVELGVIPNLVIGAGDENGGATDDVFVGTTGTKGLYEADTMKLLYKSAAGVLTGIAVDTTAFCKAPTVTYWQMAATAGGNAIVNTADGTAIFLKTS